MRSRRAPSSTRNKHSQNIKEQTDNIAIQQLDLKIEEEKKKAQKL
jgi:hypothetical protein